MISHTLHDLAPAKEEQTFLLWRSLLQKVRKEAITGFAVDRHGNIIPFEKGQKKEPQ